MSRGGRLNTQIFGKEKGVVQGKKELLVLHLIPEAHKVQTREQRRESGTKWNVVKTPGETEFGANALDLETQ